MNADRTVIRPVTYIMLHVSKSISYHTARCKVCVLILPITV